MVQDVFNVILLHHFARLAAMRALPQISWLLANLAKIFIIMSDLVDIDN